MKIMKERWVAIEGNLFSAVKKTLTSDHGVKVEVQEAVGFNLGTEVAKHVAELHNRSLPNPERYGA